VGVWEYITKQTSECMIWTPSAKRTFCRLVLDHPRVWTRAEKEQLKASLARTLGRNEGDYKAGPIAARKDALSYDHLPLQRQLELLAEDPLIDGHRDPEVLTILRKVHDARWALHPRVLHAASKVVVACEHTESHGYLTRIFEAILPHVRLLNCAEREDIFFRLPPHLLDQGFEVWGEHTDEEAVLSLCRVLGTRGVNSLTCTFLNRVPWWTFRRHALVNTFLSLARAQLCDVKIFTSLIDELLIRHRFMTNDEKQQVFLTLALYKRVFDASLVLPHPLYLSTAVELKRVLATEFNDSLPLLTMNEAVRPLVALVDLSLNNRRTRKIMRVKMKQANLMMLDKPEHFSSLVYAFKRISDGIVVDQLGPSLCTSFMRWLPLMDVRMIYTSLEALSLYCTQHTRYVFFEAFVRLCEFGEKDPHCLTRQEMLQVLTLYRGMTPVRKDLSHTLWHRLLPLCDPHLPHFSTPQLTSVLRSVQVAGAEEYNPLPLYNALFTRLHASGGLISPKNCARVWEAVADLYSSVGVPPKRLMKILSQCVEAWFEEPQPHGLTPEVLVSTLHAASSLDVDAPWMPHLIAEATGDDIVYNIVETPTLAGTLIDALFDVPGGHEALARLGHLDGDEGFVSLQEELILMTQARRSKAYKHVSHSVLAFGDTLGQLRIGRALAHAPREDALLAEQLRASGGFDLKHQEYYDLPWAHPVYKIGIMVVPKRVTTSFRLQWRFWKRKGWLIVGVRSEDLKKEPAAVPPLELSSRQEKRFIEQIKEAGANPPEELRQKAFEQLARQLEHAIGHIVEEDVLQLGPARERFNDDLLSEDIQSFITENNFTPKK